MPRPRTGVNTVTRRRPDGSIAEVVYYHLGSRARIGSSAEGMTRERAIAIAQEIDREPQYSGPREGSFGWLVSQYLASPKFAKKKPNTQREYRRYVEQLRARWEHMHVEHVSRSNVAALLIEKRERPYEANAAIRVLRLLYSWGRQQLGLTCPNPAEATELHQTEARTAIWGENQINRFLASAPPELALAMSLLLYTVQRPSDVLLMTAGRVEERDGRLWLLLRQQKTEELVAVPCHRKLEPALRARLQAIRASEATRVEGGAPEPASTLLVPSRSGRTWRYRAFASLWDRTLRRCNLRLARELLRQHPLPSRQRPTARQAAKQAVRDQLLLGLQRRDLRRTGMVQLAMAGATIPQIAALSGHSIEHTTRVIETYLPRRAEVALAGVEAWETSERKALALLPRGRKR